MTGILHMPRTVLMSLLVIAGTLAVVSTAFTFATFTDDGTASGDVTAGNVDLSLDGADGAVALTFNEAYCGDIAFGETCTADVVVKNEGSLSFDLSVVPDPLTESAPGCYSSSVAATVPGPTGAGGDYKALDTETWTVSLTLDDGGVPGNHVDDNDCQNATASVNVTFTATQSASPHD